MVARLLAAIAMEMAVGYFWHFEAPPKVIAAYENDLASVNQGGGSSSSIHV